MLKSLLEPILATAGGTLLDPLGEGWYANVDLSSLLGPDGIHPNALGNRYIADKIAQSLTAHGLVFEPEGQ
jgi:lysophospholipase L1-like esterase